MSDLAAGDRVAVHCPACSPAADTVHEVIKPGGQSTLRCTDCGHVHKERVEPGREASVPVVVSQGGESFTARVDVPAGKTFAVGEEFVVDGDEALLTARITAVELPGGDRVEEASADALGTVWTRAVDNVGVDVTLHPGDGRRADSRSFRVHVPGDEEFVVGEERTAGDEEFEVEGILPRDDVEGYPAGRLDREGDAVPAKDVKRLYARDRSGDAWSVW